MVVGLLAIFYAVLFSSLSWPLCHILSYSSIKISLKERNTFSKYLLLLYQHPCNKIQLLETIQQPSGLSCYLSFRPTWQFKDDLAEHGYQFVSMFLVYASILNTLLLNFLIILFTFQMLTHRTIWILNKHGIKDFNYIFFKSLVYCILLCAFVFLLSNSPYHMWPAWMAQFILLFMCGV